jgi:Insulin-induced protein (INSIG)
MSAPPPEHIQSSPPLLRPKPRRPFELSGSSNESSNPSTPLKSLDAPFDPKDSHGQGDISRNRSIMNLTSSTLFGIYGQPTTLGEQPSEPQTPWGTGAETPSRNGSVDNLNLNLSPRGGRDNSIAELEARLLRTSGHRRKSSGRRSPVELQATHHAPRRRWSAVITSAVIRVIVLFAFGVAYGALVAHLHDHRQLAPVKVDAIDHASWGYLAFWGFSGVGIGSLLPWVDFLWENGSGDDYAVEQEETKKRGLPVEWNDVVRSVGAFVGIAFAIVRPSSR